MRSASLIALCLTTFALTARAGDLFAKSALLETQAAKAALSIEPGVGAKFVYAIEVAPRKKIARTWYLSTEFIPKADPHAVVLVQSVIKPGTRRFTITSETQAMRLYGDFIARIHIYADAGHHRLLGHHTQYVPVEVDEETMEELGIKREPPASAPNPNANPNPDSAPDLPNPTPAPDLPNPTPNPNPTVQVHGNVQVQGG